MDAPVDVGVTEGFFERTLRSGRSYVTKIQRLTYSVVKLPASFDLPSLLHASMEEEAGLWEENRDECPADEQVEPYGLRPLQAGTSESVDRPVTSQQPCWSVRRPEGSTLTLKHAIKKRKREGRLEEEGHVPRASMVKKFVSSATMAARQLDCANLPVTSGAYTAKNVKPSGAQDVHIAENLVNENGFTLDQWDGISSKAYVDQGKHIFVILAGRPDDEGYMESANAMYDLMKTEAQNAGFESAEAHRRGQFPVINVGVTHGNGTDEPLNRDNRTHSSMVDRLLADPNVIRLASFASASFQMWQPKVYGYYKERLRLLFETMSSLRRIFPRSIFPAAAFNFGPNVWTFKHRDIFNCPFGFCAIQALGRFNPKKGGHIILWEAKLVIEFPPGSLILIPSATITHSNTPVAEGEERASFTQYCPGGLFRYVDSGFQKEKTLKAKNPALYKAMQERRPKMWEVGLGLLSKPEDFKARVAAL